ncbi:hypothetical protein ACFXPA_04640 [Amycolatopsis sp. NPDC059090]|uniref:hypothetical protein n=1 Tax=unclassified Amycolatopsis TaxID=2618356 RepID=UPI003670C869
MRDHTEPPAWRRLYDAPGFVHETVDHRGRTWRMWFADTDAPGDPHPRGWRLAPLATLNQAAFVPHTGDGQEFDTAAELIAADEVARDLRDHTRARRTAGERPPVQARIRLLDETAPISLHMHLPGRQHAEAVAITLNQDTGVLATRIFDDTLPDRTVSWAIPCVTTAAANRVLQDVARLVPPLLAATPAVPYEVRSPAERAHRRIREHLASAFSDHDLVLGMYAGEWFENDPASSGITAATRDDELAEWVSTYEKDVASGRWRRFFPRGLDIGLCRHVVLRGTRLWASTHRDLLRERSHTPRHPPSRDRAEHRLL